MKTERFLKSRLYRQILFNTIAFALCTKVQDLELPLPLGNGQDLTTTLGL
jgi:hypothetical protein